MIEELLKRAEEIPTNEPERELAFLNIVNACKELGDITEEQRQEIIKVLLKRH